MLAGKVAIVTGAASGIGRATAAVFLRNGARVLAVDIDDARLRSAFPDSSDVVTLAVDIGSADSAQRAVAAVQGRWQRLDILFNNAGLGARIPGESGYRSVAETPDEHWQRIVDINLNAQFRLTKTALPLLRGSGAGRVIMTGSPLAHHSYFGVAAYSATKSGLAAFARAVAVEEGGHGITANWVEPGGIMTGMTEHIYSRAEERERIAQKSPLKRLGDSEDVANVVLFLASDLSAYVTGHGIRVDGGATLGI